MSKLTDSFRTVGVYNPHGFYVHGNVFIAYLPAEGGLASRPGRWVVSGVGFETDPDGHWRNYGNKTFGVYGGRGSHAERKSQSFAQAKAWASERYGITEWAKDPYGSYGDASFVKARVAELKREVREAGS